MGYFIDPDGNYPRHAGDVQLILPNWQEGEDPLPEGWHSVEDANLPTIDSNQVVEEHFPKIVDGKYVRNFVVRDMTEGEIGERNLFELRSRVFRGEPITADEAALLVG